MAKKRLSIGGSNFGEFVRENYLFVDKSLFIKEIIDDTAKVVVITRPRRWGKTSNMSMLYHFLVAEAYGRKTQGLFDNLLIAKDPGNYVQSYQGKYPAIFLTLKDLKATTFEIALEDMTTIIRDAYCQYKNLLTNPGCRWDDVDRKSFEKYLNEPLTQADLANSLLLLSGLLYKHYQQHVYILIDEYDTPLNFAFSHSNYFEPMSILLRNFLSRAMKDNTYLAKGIMTGILRVSKDSMLSGLNNPQIYTVLKDRRYAPYFGFTDQELNSLFENQELTKDEGRVKEWYNGYHVNGLTLYNPWSIVSTLINQAELKPYWINTADDSLLKNLLQNASVDTKKQFERLMLNKSITVDISDTMRFDQVSQDESMLWNLLVSAGYLTMISSFQQRTRTFYEIKIPNFEVLGLYEEIFMTWLITPNQTFELQRFLEKLTNGEVEQFAIAIEKILKSAASVHDYANQPEAFYHGFILALTVSLMDRYYIFSNHESGLGRPDLLIIPKNTEKSLAVILEFKSIAEGGSLEESAKQALAQIQQKEYAAIIVQYSHVQSVMHVGMVFDGKRVKCESSINPV